MRSALVVAASALALGAGCRVALDEPKSRSSVEACKVLDLEVCNAARGKSDYTFVYDKILSKNCTGSSCHQADSSDPMAALLPFDDKELAYASLVGAPSRIEQELLIVAPGKPRESYMLYLMQTITEDEFDLPVNEPPDEVGFMPRSNSALCCQKLQAVEDWVSAGAMP